MKKVVIYCRVSTEVQMNEKTIDSQKEELIAYCKKSGFVWLDTYADDGYSGAMLARPELDRLRDDAKAKKFEAVVVHAVDRLSRSHIHAGVVMEELQRHGVELIFLNAPPTDTPEGRLLFDIQSVVAQFEKEKIKERTRRGRLHKANKGIIVGNTPPFGYQYVKRNNVGVYEIDEDQADIVRLIFDLYAKKNLSFRGVLKALYDMQIPPPKGGKKWGSSTLLRIISNETYTGVTYYHKTLSYEPLKRRTEAYHRIKNTGRKIRPREEWIPIRVPVILSRELFDLANRKRETNALLSKRNTKHPYLLRGLLTHSCEYKMQCQEKRHYFYYRCSERQNSFPLKKNCDGSYPADMLDNLVWGAVVKVLRNPKSVNKYLNANAKNSTKNKLALTEKVQKLTRQLADLEAKEKDIANDYTSGVLRVDQVAVLMNAFDIKRQDALKKKADIESELESMNNQTISDQNIESTLRDLGTATASASFELRREVLKLLVDKITIQKRKAILKLKIPALPEGKESFVFTPS